MNPRWTADILGNGNNPTTQGIYATAWMKDYLELYLKLNDLGCSDGVNGLAPLTAAVVQYGRSPDPYELDAVTDVLKEVSEALGVDDETGVAEASPKNAETSPKNSVITYPNPGLIIDEASANKNLSGASGSFKRYAAQLGAKAHAEEQKGCGSDQGGIEVDGYATGGYATGLGYQCGPFATIWYQTDQGWKEITAQETWGCDQLGKLGVPAKLFAADQRICLTSSGDEIPYDHS